MALQDRTRLLRTVRLVSALLTVLAVVALAVFAAIGGATVTRHTTVVRQAAARPAPKSKAASRVPAVQPSTTGGSLESSAPLVAASPTSPVPALAPAAAPPTSPPAAGAVTSSVEPSEPDPGDLPACPLPVNAPANPGGLQSLVTFAPYLGPFSSEAFAMAPAFQPVLQAVGPFLVALATAYGSAPASVTSGAAQVESLENDGYSAISPLYGPNRSQFLAAETQLATALAPVAEGAADTQTTSCLVDIEAALTSAAAAG